MAYLVLVPHLESANHPHLLVFLQWAAPLWATGALRLAGDLAQCLVGGDVEEKDGLGGSALGCDDLDRFALNQHLAGEILHPGRLAAGDAN